MSDDKTIKIYYPTLMNGPDVVNPANYPLVDSIYGSAPAKMGTGEVDFSPSGHLNNSLY